jgi:hypothetical protein
MRNIIKGIVVASVLRMLFRKKGKSERGGLWTRNRASPSSTH